MVLTPPFSIPRSSQKSLEVMQILQTMSTSSGKPAPVAPGDLLVITAVKKLSGQKYLLASFHGDTNGLATIPITTAVNKYATEKKPNHKLLFGMDANTYTNPESDQQGVVEFAEYYSSEGLTSSWGTKPDPINFTTFHARTHLYVSCLPVCLPVCLSCLSVCVCVNECFLVANPILLPTHTLHFIPFFYHYYHYYCYYYF